MHVSLSALIAITAAFDKFTALVFLFSIKQHLANINEDNNQQQKQVRPEAGKGSLAPLFTNIAVRLIYAISRARRMACLLITHAGG